MSSPTNLRAQIAAKNSPPASPAGNATGEADSLQSSASDTSECYASGDNALGVLVNTGDTLFAFPYAHYMFAQTVDKSGVAIRFATHKILLVGEGLETIVQDLAEQRLTALRVIPKRFAVQRKTAVWIDRIEVAEVSEEPATS